MLTIDETAQRLNVSRQTIYRMLTDGELKGVKVRGATRIIEESIVDYMTAHGWKQE